MVGSGTSLKRLTVLVALACAPLRAQPTLTLQEVGVRNAAAEFLPKYLDQRVVVRGIVNSAAFHFPDHSLLAIDDGDYGAILRVKREDARLDPYRPGNELQVQGTVAVFAGMAVIL